MSEITTKNTSNNCGGGVQIENLYFKKVPETNVYSLIVGKS